MVQLSPIEDHSTGTTLHLVTALTARWFQCRRSDANKKKKKKARRGGSRGMLRKLKCVNWGGGFKVIGIMTMDSIDTMNGSC